MAKFNRRYSAGFTPAPKKLRPLGRRVDWKSNGTLEENPHPLRWVRGFTVMEMMVVLGFIILMMGMLIVYNRSGDRQILLFREQYSIINAVARAKSLAIATFGQPNVPCGYGVHFEPGGNYFLFKDLPQSGNDCSTANRVYVVGDTNELVSAFKLASGISFSGLSVSDIVFVPPDPRVYINPDQPTATIVIKIDIEGTSVQIKVNKAGQIST